MSGTQPVFVNDRKVDIPIGTTAEGAVRLIDDAAAAAVADGKAYLTDGRGIRLEPVLHAAQLHDVVEAVAVEIRNGDSG